MAQVQQLATCGNADGNGTAVSNAECGFGYVYNAVNHNSRCSGAVCDISEPDNHAICCVRKSRHVFDQIEI